MTATLRDVALAAGVSTSTVSRALSKPDLVNGVTRERVRVAAERLGYPLSRSSAGLAAGRTGHLAIVVPDLTNPLFAGVVKGAQARARESDYALFVADTNEDVGAEWGIAAGLASEADGLVLCSPRGDVTEIARIGEQVPLVLMHRRYAEFARVTVDNVDGMRQAVAHLAALGHRRVAFVAGPRTSAVNAEREEGLRAAAADHAIDVVELGNFRPTFDGGVAAADLVAAAGVTGVIGYNDILALGIISRLHDRGVHVPEDLSVVGFDDIAMAGMSRPPLTTVAIPQEQAGRTAIDLLVSGLTGVQGDPRHVEIPAHLMVRSTTTGAPGTAWTR